MPDHRLEQVCVDIEPVGAFFRIHLPDFAPSEGSPEAVGLAVYRQLGVWLVDEIRGRADGSTREQRPSAADGSHLLATRAPARPR